MGFFCLQASSLLDREIFSSLELVICDCGPMSVEYRYSRRTKHAVRRSTSVLQSLGRLEMQIFTMNYLMTMRHSPQLDGKIVGYGVVWTLAIAAAVTWIIV